MRIVLLVFVAISLGWAAWSLATANVSGESPIVDESADDVDVEAADSAAPDDPVGAEPSDSSPRDRIADPVTAAFYKIVEDLVTGRSSAKDRAALEEAVVRAALERKLAGETEARAAAAASVGLLLKDASRYETAPTAAITPLQEEAFLGVAERYARKLERGLAYGGLNAPHDGVFVSATLDVTLPKGIVEAPWDLLGGFEWRDGRELPAAVRDLDGKEVGIAGYMMSIGQTEQIREFLLVESQWSCCFGLPPEVHQVVVVRIPDGDPAIELVNVPIVILGRLSVGEEREDGWVTSVYRLVADAVEIVE